MAQPVEYNRSYDFTTFQEDFSTQPLPAAQVDINLDNAAISINQIIARLVLIQRDDGAIANSLVTLESLATDVLSALGTTLNPMGSWLTTTVYSTMDLVEESGNTYLAAEDHTAGVFATDLAADKWILFSLGSTGSQPIDAMLTAISGLTSSADQMMIFTGPDAVSTTSLTTFAKTLLDDANAAAMRATLGLVIGTDVQTQDSTLQALTGALTAADKIPYATALDVLGELDFKDEDNMASNSDTALASQQSIKAYVDAAIVTPMFTKEASSAEQTITAGGTATLVHGFGTIPKNMVFTLVCKTAEHGYSIGDVIIAKMNSSTTTLTRLNSVVFDSTSIDVKFTNSATVFADGNKTTGAGASLTNANWKFVITAQG